MTVESTAEVMDEIVTRLHDYADEIARMTKRMRETKDLTYAGECLNTLSNMNINLRLDLLATRPIREMQKQIYELERKLEE